MGLRCRAVTADVAAGAPAPQERAFLFTDLEDHSALWDADPAGTAAVIEEHDRLLSGLVVAAGGAVVKSTGDGVMAAFEQAAAAVGAARAIQEQVVATPWPVGPVRVRIGLHAGPAYERGGDWFGPTVALAARLCDAAHGGQVVASEAVVQLARDEAWADLGEHRFHGVRRPERVHQLVVDGRSDFPALRNVEQGADRLPRPATSFVGRGAELAEVLAALRADRLVTLTSIGGGGKTRLAIEAARALLPELPDGADLVDLAPVPDGDGVAAALAAALHLDRDDTDRRPATERVLAHCRGRRALVVVDNCEHLLDGVAAMVEPLLDGCPGIRLLATSREPLHVAGERVLPVPSLAPDAAVGLFLARATSAGGAVDDDELPAVAEVCARLDGIPLAVELAAARTAHLTVRELADRLDDRFRLLTGGNRRLQRQQTLQATLDWTHDLLTDDERALLRRLAVFAGWFRLERAEALWGGDLLDLLGSLVERNMVVHDPATARYRLLETVRLYAELQLLAAGEAEQWRTRHRDVFAALVTAPPLEALVHVGETARALVDERPDLRAAVRWSIDRGDWNGAATIVHRLPAIYHLAGDASLAELVGEVIGHLDDGSDLRFLCALAALVSLQTRIERAGVDVSGGVSTGDAADRIRAAAELGRARGDDVGRFLQALAAFNLIGLGLGLGAAGAEHVEEGRRALADAVAAVDTGPLSVWTSYVVGLGGLVRVGTGGRDEGMAMLRRSAGVDDGHRNDDYLALYALLCLEAGDPDAIDHAWRARRRAAYGFGRVAALLAVAIGEASRGNVELARGELVGSLPEYERGGAGLRAGFVLAAAGVVRREGGAELAARWIGAADAAGPEKGPHVRYAADWQAAELSGELAPGQLEAARAAGRVAGVDPCFAEVVAWLDAGPTPPT